MEWLGSLGIGLLVGLISSFLGLGGGILIVPLLPLVSELSHLEVVATSLTAILFVVSNNTASFSRKGLVDWHTVWLIGPLTAVGAFAAGFAADLVPVWALKALLAAVIVFLVIKNLTGFGQAKRPAHKSEDKKGRMRRLSGALLGGFSGVISGFTGIGSGAIIAPSLANFGWVSGPKVVPTTNAVMIFTSFFGALAFSFQSKGSGLSLGMIHLDKALLIVIGAVLSSYWGRSRQEKIPNRWRKRLLTLVLVVLSIKVLVEILLEVR